MNEDRHPGFGAHTLRLAATYLAIIMIMSLGFSAVFYVTSSNQLGRQLPQDFGQKADDHHGRPLPAGYDDDLDRFLQSRITEGRHDLLIQLVELNFVALLVGGGISVMLARRTLRPIERAMQAQSQFVSDASHELRTPLTALRTSNEVALRRPKISDAEAREILQYNVEESIKLKALSDALLGLLKEGAEAGEIVHLNDVIDAAVAHIKPAADAKQVALVVPATDKQVRGSLQGLTQVLTILLDNAVKYSDEKGEVRVLLPASTKRAIISVTDKGIGITENDLPHLFERFYRSDKARQRNAQGGFGLGLSIAQKIVRAHHGSITAKSVPGKGSTLTVSLPLA
jgi:two-component system sensor histidine kinase CiaH